MFFGALCISGGLSLFASSSPDGLEKIAKTQGFHEKESQFSWGIFLDYRIPGIQDVHFSTALAGIAGTIFVFGILFFLGKVLYRSEKIENNNV